MATQWGIVSAGKISHDFTTCLRSLPQDEHKVVAVAARNLASAKEFAKLHNIPHAYGSYEEIAKCNDVQIVYIGAINTQHYPIGKMMLEAGKHVLIEKPCTLNCKLTQALIDLAREKKLFFMEAIWSRFLPSYRFAMKQVEDDAIGDVVHIDANFGIPIENVERIFKKDMGGGTILDIGVYAINVVDMFFGGEKPSKICAIGHLNTNGVDKTMSAALMYANGKTATISTHAIAKLPCEANISGTKGIVKIPEPMWCSDKIIVNGKVHEFPYPETVVPCNYGNSSGLRYQAIEARNCIRSGLQESSLCSWNDSLRIASIQDELRRQIGVKYEQDN